MDGWMDGWMGGWMDGSKSRVKDCLQQSKIGQRVQGLDTIYKKLTTVFKPVAWDDQVASWYRDRSEQLP